MAISNSIVKLQGTVAGLTFVNSRRYGDHVRASRGTYKEAKVNENFREESKLLLKANVPAKIFKDAIGQYRNHHGGTLWPRLVSLFRSQLKKHGSIDFSRMSGFEVEDDHPFSRILQVRSTIALKKNGSMLSVQLQSDSHPRFPQASHINKYRLTMIGIFPDLENRTAQTTSVTSEVISSRDAISYLRTELHVPPSSRNFIVCAKIDGLSNGLVSTARSTHGLIVIDGGVI